MVDKSMLGDLAKARVENSALEHLLTFFRTWLDVSDVMTKKVITISPHETVSVATRIMVDNNVSSIVIVDNGSVIGILSETDFLSRAVSQKSSFSKIKVAELMSSPVVTVSPDYSILEAAKIAAEKHVKKLPVVKNGQLAGIITQTDLIQAMTSYDMWWEIVDIMTPGVIEIQANTTVAEAAQIMTSRNISCIAVCQADEVVGVFTETDLIKRVTARQKDPAGVEISQVMSSPVISVSPDCSIFNASRIMGKMDIRRLLCMEGRRLCGIVTQTDIFTALRDRIRAEEDCSQILIIDDDHEDAMILQRYLSCCHRRTIESDYASDLEQALEKLSRKYFDLIFLDNRLTSGMTAKHVLENFKRENVDIPVIIITGQGDRQMAIDLMKKGAYDYIVKDDLNPELIEKIILGTARRHMLKVMQNKVGDALNKSEERYRRITKAVTDYIFTVFFENGRQVQTTHSETSVAVTGYSPQELTEDPHLWINMVHPDDREAVLQQAQRCISGQDVEPLEHRIVHKGGSIRWLKNTLVRHFDLQGNLLSYDGLLKDITERKMAEEKLEQTNRQLEASLERAHMLAQEAVAASSAKSEFLANMSHEIRTPLNAVMGFSELMAHEKLSEQQARHVDIIRESGENLLHLVNGILDLSQIESGKLSISIADCPLEQLLTTVELLMRPSAKEKNLEFQILRQGQLPRQIRTDPIRLRQCLHNLICNAIKFTDKGHVYLKVCLQNIKNEAHICFEVEDTGIGISSDKQEVIFDAFTQVVAGPTREYGGIGLGLAITKQLANLLNGKLLLTSKPGAGSVFSIAIPIDAEVKFDEPLFDKCTEPNKPKERPKKPKRQEFVGRVLVVEDSRTNQVLIRLLLKRLGLKAEIVEDGQKAVDAVMKGSFDLIFMDIRMPNMNGYDATKILRKNKITTPIVALTAHVMKGAKKKCISAGCDDYLPKPIDRKKLLEVVRKYLPLKKSDSCDKIEPSGSEVNQPARLCSEQRCSSVRSSQSVDIEECESVVNWSSLVKICDSENVIEEIRQIFLDDAPRSIEFIANAIKTKNIKDIEFYAHRLKGSARCVTAEQLFDQTNRLEQAGREKDMVTAASVFHDVKAQYEKVRSFLSQPNWIEIAKQQENNKQIIPSWS